ncbi:16351_t:CDS:2, partial [Racocetra persica]
MTKKKKGGKTHDALLNQNGFEHTDHDNDLSNHNGVEQKINDDNIKKWKNMSVRAFWTFIMIGGFFICLALGHSMVVILVVIIQTLVFKEVIALTHVP